MSWYAPWATISLFVMTECFGIPLRATTFAQVTSTCTDFPTKSGHDIIRVSFDDIMMMWAFQMMKCESQLCQGWGYKRKNAWREGVLSFKISSEELIGLN